MKLSSSTNMANHSDHRAKKSSLAPMPSIDAIGKSFLAIGLVGLSIMVCSILWSIFKDAPFILVLIGVAFLILVGWIAWRRRQAIQKALKKADEVSGGEVTFGEAGIRWRYETGTERELEWPGITSWTRTDRTVILRHMLGQDFLIAIPADPAAADELMRTLEKNLPPPR